MTSSFSNQVPVLRVIKSTPDFIWLEWNKGKDVRLSEIELYNLFINGKIKTILPPTENKFVVNDGELGKRYIFQLEMIRKNGKAIRSLSICINWPGVTLPRQQIAVNDCQEAIVSWGDSMSINDGDIQSYTLYLYDFDDRLLKTFGPYSTGCRQVCMKDLTPGAYFTILEIKLINSNRSMRSKPMKIQFGKDSLEYSLTCNDFNSTNRKRLINMICHLINIRDNMESKHLLEKCDTQLEQALLDLKNLTDSIHLNLTIESKSNHFSRNHRLINDDEENIMSVPRFIKQFSIKLPRSEIPYEFSVSVKPDLDCARSNKVIVEASGFSFFCAHFDQQRHIKSCLYMETFPYELQIERSIHQGLLKSPQILKNIQIYDLNENQMIRMPSLDQSRRLTILLFYLNRCIPSITHINYLSTYASSHRRQCNYISINCNQDNIDDLKKFTKDFKDIQCYTDFSSEEFLYEQNENTKPIHELLSIDGVPIYFILNFSNLIVWKGRFCIRNQLEYNTSMDHTLAEINQIKCTIDNCKICHYRVQ